MHKFNNNSEVRSIQCKPQEIGNFVTQKTRDELKPLGTQEKPVDTTRLSREMWSTQKSCWNKFNSAAK